MNSRHFAFAKLFLILSGSAMPAFAQTPIAASELSALETARAEFSAKVLSSSRQLNEQYSRALAKLEEELAIEGNYEEALTVQSRIADLRRLLQRSPVGQSGTPITLSTSAAQLSGVSLDEGYLTRWRSASSHAEWSVPKITPGNYIIEITYLLTNGTGSSTSNFRADTVFRIQEVSLLSSSAQFRDLTLPRSEDALTYAEVRTEPLSFVRSTFSLRLESIKFNSGDLIRIGGVKLIPVDSPAPPPPLTAPAVTLNGEKEVESLRQIFLKRLSAARAPLLSEYEAKLKTLQAQPGVLADTDLSELILAEQKRLSSAPPLGGRDGKKGPLEKLPGHGLEGFEDLSDVQWVADPANTAERFKVSHEGKEFWIKTAWIKSPPPTPDKSGELHSAAKAFGIADDDALSIGRIAAEYARGHLEGKPLRLLVKSQHANKKEASPALVFVDGTGLFQVMLIDYGFATYSPPEGPMQKTLLELALMRMLQERQDKAKSKSPSPGAWAFRADPSIKP